jgi:hypothetical protein
MDSQAFIKDLMQKLMALDGTKLDDFEGCTEKEIQLLMKTQNVERLPQMYVEFMKAMGRSYKSKGLRFFVGEDIGYEDALELKEVFAEVLKDENKDWQIPENAFVFWTHHAYIFYYFLIDEGDDPRIFEYIESKEPRKIADSFSQLLDWQFRIHQDFIFRTGRDTWKVAWHFSDGFLRFNNEVMKVSGVLSIETGGKPIANKNGFDASIRPLDALRWYTVRPQTAFIISRVRLSGEIVEEKQRLIAQRREHVWVADARPLLRDFVELQKARYLDIQQTVIDLKRLTYKWIQPDYIYDPQRDKPKNLDTIPRYPLGNQILEYTDYVFRLKAEAYSLRIWEKALMNKFDLEAYFKQGDQRFSSYVQDTMNDEDKLIWAIENPPQEYAKFFTKPKDPNDMFHEMLMQLAPEGYRE